VKHLASSGVRAHVVVLLGAAALPLSGAAARGLTAATISFPSPFAACRSNGGNAFENAEVEPSIAVAPGDRRVIVVYQQDRFPDAAARGIAGSVSDDGGGTWRRTLIPVGACAGGLGPARTSDPWVSVGPDGRAYALASSTAVTSTDGGRTWTNPHTLATTTASFLPDKASISAHPTRRGVAYAVWSRYHLRKTGPPVQGDSMFVRTHDGGRTWTTPRVILRHGADSGPIASVILADPRRRRLYHFTFWQVGVVPTLKRPSRLVVQSSSDGGSTWSAPRRISRALTVGVSRDPTSGREIRGGAVVPSFAVDRSSGAVYAVWQDSRFASKRVDQIVVAISRDGGKTWTSPQLVSRRGRQAFVPTVAVTPAGVVGIAYFEAPRGRSRLQRPIQYELAVSRDRGRTFHRRAVGRAFGLADAPLLSGIPALAVPPGLFLGDYMGIDASDGRFHLAFVTANRSTSNRTDVRYASISP
jgi:hypothetical protein